MWLTLVSRILADAAGSTGMVPYIALDSDSDKVTLLEFVHPAGDKDVKRVKAKQEVGVTLRTERN